MIGVLVSGGQQQRVGFAQALAARPEIKLLGEAFGTVAPPTRDELRNDFLRPRRQPAPLFSAVTAWRAGLGRADGCL